MVGVEETEGAAAERSQDLVRWEKQKLDSFDHGALRVNYLESLLLT